MKFICIKDVKEKTALGRSTIYKKIDEGTFPPQVSIGAHKVVWIESEVDDWIEEQISRSRDRSKGKTKAPQIFRHSEFLLRQSENEDYFGCVPQTEGDAQEGVQ